MANDSQDPSQGLTYRQAGVDVDAGNRLVDTIKPVAARTQRPEVLTGLGGFGALFQLPLERYRQPVLVAGTDGVGTKLRLALDLNRHDTVGIDLVAMCANDVVVQGAEPLFFLDYFATARLDVNIAAQVVTGIGQGCELAGCALIGGETAEMPSMYQGADYDMAGFCVGVVERDSLIDGHQVATGDSLIGLASSGLHANGFSLVRRILADAGADPAATPLGGHSLGDALLAPTRIYVPAVLALLRAQPVHALAHITGGGLMENIPRVLPEDKRAVIDPSRWSRPAIIDWVQDHGRIADKELYRTFNCGIGFVACVPAATRDTALALLRRQGETAWVIGHIEDRREQQAAIEIEGVT